MFEWFYEVFWMVYISFDPEMTFIYVMPLDEEYNGYGLLENGGYKISLPDNILELADREIDTVKLFRGGEKQRTRT